jgi:hypothetical protein
MTSVDPPHWAKPFAGSAEGTHEEQSPMLSSTPQESICPAYGYPEAQTLFFDLA